ncbi:MAG: rubredoxin [Christensenellaceae bacterium]|jgi:rubredoxin|nr:rubredoxin [Christensenellaceae bacterium]
MVEYICTVCGYTYNEEFGNEDCGIAPGTKWDDIPDDFTCPICGMGKDGFTLA